MIPINPSCAQINISAFLPGDPDDGTVVDEELGEPELELELELEVELEVALADVLEDDLELAEDFECLQRKMKMRLRTKRTRRMK